MADDNNGAIGELPTSLALEEAKPESLNDLLSRLPDNEHELTRQIEALRAQRERWMKAQTSTTSTKAPKVRAAKDVNLAEITVSAEELGF